MAEKSSFLSNVGSGMINTVFGGLTSLFGQSHADRVNRENMKKQYEYQSALQEQQNRFNENAQIRQNDLTMQLFNKGNAFNAEQAELANQRNRENQSDALALTREGAQKAGLNVNFLNGSTAVGASSPNAVGSPSTAPTPLGVSGGAIGLPSSQNALFGADPMGDYLKYTQAKKVESETKGQDIQNDREIALDSYFNQFGFNTYSLDENGEQVAEFIKFKNKGDFEAFMKYRESDALSSEYSMRKSRAILDQYVSSSQYLDPNTKQSLVDMPNQIYNELYQKVQNYMKDISVKDEQIHLFKSEAELNELQTQIKDDQNIFAYIDKMFDEDKDFTFKDLIKLFALVFVANGSGAYPSRKSPKKK